MYAMTERVDCIGYIISKLGIKYEVRDQRQGSSFFERLNACKHGCCTRSQTASWEPGPPAGKDDLCWQRGAQNFSEFQGRLISLNCTTNSLKTITTPTGTCSQYCQQTRFKCEKEHPALSSPPHFHLSCGPLKILKSANMAPTVLPANGNPL